MLLPVNWLISLPKEYNGVIVSFYAPSSFRPPSIAPNLSTRPFEALVLTAHADTIYSGRKGKIPPRRILRRSRR